MPGGNYSDVPRSKQVFRPAKMQCEETEESWADLQEHRPHFGRPTTRQRDLEESVEGLIGLEHSRSKALRLASRSPIVLPDPFLVADVWFQLLQIALHQIPHEQSSHHHEYHQHHLRRSAQTVRAQCQPALDITLMTSNAANVAIDQNKEDRKH